MPPRRLRLYFDGGCRPNPGAIETAVVVRGIEHVQRDAGIGDNADAEWLALIHAADVARAMLADMPDAPDVEFLGDSTQVIAQAGGDQPCRDARFVAHRARFLALTGDMARVRLRHVRRSQNLAGIVLDRRLRHIG
ncbi:ribonuclease HI [Sphingomonas naphthae]|uniref:Ribonuclease HI n=1 Tax=Sphingomonas naphthae TaxID=1813468 RepID=A0ABY7TMX7_9SPHN|nr:ribonuclease HI [Sphingomonas naphthae]WCT74368.1 ribonuclease HI [Sphingomonas naphthae]